MWPATAAAGDAPSALSVAVSGVRQGGATEAAVHCTRVWCGVWVVWCAAVLVAGG